MRQDVEICGNARRQDVEICGNARQCKAPSPSRNAWRGTKILSMRSGNVGGIDGGVFAAFCGINSASLLRLKDFSSFGKSQNARRLAAVFLRLRTAVLGGCERRFCGEVDCGDVQVFAATHSGSMWRCAEVLRRSVPVLCGDWLEKPLAGDSGKFSAIFFGARRL